MTAVTTTSTCKSNNDIINSGVNFDKNNNTPTLIQSPIYTSYASQQFTPTNLLKNSTAQSLVCSTPASATATIINEQRQNSIKYQQQSALQQYYNQTSASSSLIPSLNNDINPNSTLTSIELHAYFF